MVEFNNCWVLNSLTFSQIQLLTNLKVWSLILVDKYMLSCTTTTTAMYSTILYLCHVHTSFLLFFLDRCMVNGKDYKDGDTFYKPQNPVQENNIGCHSCVCNRGVTHCNNFYNCDFPFPCEKYIPAPQGLCCPKCGKTTFNNASALAPVVPALSTR